MVSEAGRSYRSRRNVESAGKRDEDMLDYFFFSCRCCFFNVTLNLKIHLYCRIDFHAAVEFYFSYALSCFWCCRRLSNGNSN